MKKEINWSLSTEEENPDRNCVDFRICFESVWLQTALEWTQYINILFKLLLETLHDENKIY